MRIACVCALIVCTRVSMLGAQQVMTPAPTDTVGCYRAAPHLTYSAFGEPERGDTAWAIVRLERDGTARRPLLRSSLDRSSKWGRRADSLVVVLHDGLVGWFLTLVPSDSGWRGNARYLTDVMGGQPINRAMDLRQRSCHGLPNGELELTATPSSLVES